MKYLGILFLLFVFVKVDAQQNQAITIRDINQVGRGQYFNIGVGSNIDNLTCPDPVFEIESDLDIILDNSNISIQLQGQGTVSQIQKISSNKVRVKFTDLAPGSKYVSFEYLNAFVSSSTCGGDKQIKVSLVGQTSQCPSYSNIGLVKITRSGINIINEKAFNDFDVNQHPFAYSFYIYSNSSVSLNNLKLNIDLSGTNLVLKSASIINYYPYTFDSYYSYNNASLTISPIVGTNKYEIEGFGSSSGYYVMFMFDVISNQSIANKDYKMKIVYDLPDCNINNSTSPYESILLNPTLIDDKAIVENPNIQSNISDIDFDACSSGPFTRSFSQQINNIYNSVSTTNKAVYEISLDGTATITDISFGSLINATNLNLEKIEGFSTVTSTISDIDIVNSGLNSINGLSGVKKLRFTFSPLPTNSSFIISYNIYFPNITQNESLVYNSSIKVGTYSLNRNYSTKINKQAPSSGVSFDDYMISEDGNSWDWSKIVNVGTTYSFRAYYANIGEAVSNFKYIYNINPNLLIDASSFKYSYGTSSYNTIKNDFVSYTQLSSIITKKPSISGNVLTLDGLNLPATACNQWQYLTIYFEAKIAPSTPSDPQHTDAIHSTSTSWHVKDDGSTDFVVYSNVKCGNASASKSISVSPSSPYSLVINYDNQGHSKANDPIFLVYINNTGANIPGIGCLEGSVSSYMGQSTSVSNSFKIEYATTTDKPCLYVSTDGTQSPDGCVIETNWSSTCPSNNSNNIVLKVSPNTSVVSSFNIPASSKLELFVPFKLPSSSLVNTQFDYVVVGSANYDFFGKYVGVYSDLKIDNPFRGKSIVKVSSKSTCEIEPPIACKECIQSFSPIPNSKYTITAWVKEKVLQPSAVSGYSGPVIGVEFESGAASMSPCSVSGSSTTPNTFEFSAEGAVIEGWQRLEGTFVVPCNATAVKLKLKNNGTQEVFFDDVRVHPFNSRMKSFVYDPVTQKLTAELDEENYATFYEYDDEGSLIRVKKETERGVMTIKETRMNQAK